MLDCGVGNNRNSLIPTLPLDFLSITIKKMMKTSAFQQAIETVEALSPEEQTILLKIIQHRLQEQKRQNLIQEIKEVEQEYAGGMVKFGSVEDFLAELDEDKS
jgi:hypothetical protein